MITNKHYTSKSAACQEKFAHLGEFVETRQIPGF